MIVLIVESVPPGLRGQLSKWLLEPQAGVFVGNVSGAVRELLWEMACREVGEGNCTLVQSAANEQGYSVRTWGPTRRLVEDWEGLFLVRRPSCADEIAADAPAQSSSEECATYVSAAGGVARSTDAALARESLALRLWGKSSPYKALISHMIDTGVVAQSLLTDGCMAPVRLAFRNLFRATDEQVLSLVGFLAASHDQGKCHPLFQRQGAGLDVFAELDSMGLLQCDRVAKFRHERYSEKVFSRLARSRGLTGRGMKMCAAALRLHHQGKEGRGDEPHQALRETWHGMQADLLDALFSLFPADLSVVSQCINYDCAGVLLSGLIILSDWLASGNVQFTELSEVGDLRSYLEQARVAAKQVVIACGLGEEQALPATLSFTDLWKEISPTGVRPLQHACVEACRMYGDSGLVIVEAPMGEGKTEAAVYIAASLMKSFQKQGMYIALPTAATSNQMHGRVEKFLRSHGMHGVRLLHAMSWMIDEQTSAGSGGETEDGTVASCWTAPLRRGLLAPYAVGTIDQAMLAVMPVKYGFLRLLGISNKVLILDEVHAYDAYMSTVIERLLNWCSALSVPVVLLSATLPTKKRAAFLRAYGAPSADRADNSYPMITCAGRDAVHSIPVNDSYIKRTLGISVQPLLGLWAELARMVYARVQGGGCVCVIVNTVPEAQELYQCLKDVARDDAELWLRLFHARFAADHRKHIEDDCLARFGKEDLRGAVGPRSQRPGKAVLVATQVVEQSLDLDFDAMFSAIAPIDLVLQRAGRLHRHDGRVRPENMQAANLTVLTPSEQGDYGRSGFVYAPWILQKTESFLVSTPALNIPDGMRNAIDSVYGDDEPVGSERYKAWVEMVYSDQLNAGLAAASVLPPPDPDSFFCTQPDQDISEDDVVEDLVSVKTRLGERHTRIALLDSTLFDQANSHLPSARISRKVLLRSVSIPSRLISEEAAQGFTTPVLGEGLLKGVMLLEMHDDRFVFTTAAGSSVLKEDGELGIIFERGDSV